MSYRTKECDVSNRPGQEDTRIKERERESESESDSESEREREREHKMTGEKRREEMSHNWFLF